MKLISTDDHVVEHPTVWSDRLPAACARPDPRSSRRSRPARRTEPGRRTSGGSRDGSTPRSPSTRSPGATAPSTVSSPTASTRSCPAATTPRPGSRDMDVDGVAAQLCFPSFPKFAGTVFLQAEDRELAAPCVEAYNDFMHRRVVRLRARPVDPARDPAAVGCRLAAGRDRARARRRAPGRSPSPRTPSRWACRRSTPTSGIRCSAPRRTQGCRCACTSARRARPPTIVARRPVRGEHRPRIGVQLDVRDRRPALLAGVPPLPAS